MRTNISVRKRPREKILGYLQELREPLRLVIMLHSNTAGVEEHKKDDKPVKPLLLDKTPDHKPTGFKKAYNDNYTVISCLIPFSACQNVLQPPPRLLFPFFLPLDPAKPANNIEKFIKFQSL